MAAIQNARTSLPPRHLSRKLFHHITLQEILANVKRNQVSINIFFWDYWYFKSYAGMFFYTVTDYYILLMSEFQLYDRTFETLGWRFKLLVEDLDIRSMVWVWIWRVVLKSSAEVLGIRYSTEGLVKSGPWID